MCNNILLCYIKKSNHVKRFYCCEYDQPIEAIMKNPHPIRDLLSNVTFIRKSLTDDPCQ